MTDLESLMGTGGRDDRVSGCHGRDNVLHDTLSQTVVDPPNTKPADAHIRF